MLFNTVDKILPLSIKKNTYNFQYNFKNIQYSIYLKKKKNYKCLEKSYFFFTREKSHILVYIF